MKPIPKYIAILLVIIGFYACASTGSPDGGPYDEDPPNLYVLYLSQMQPIILVRRFQSNLMNLSNLKTLLRR